MKKIIILAVLLALEVSASAQTHPYLVVNNSDKPAVLDKIRTQQWAKESYEQILERVAPYVERHKKDPEWILSRYQMNWAEGKRYTDFYATKHITLDGASGDAPVPTVRVATYSRSPVNSQGNTYQLPPLEELVPYDTAEKMSLIDPDTKGKVQQEPWGLRERINRQVNQLALESAMIYWLTGKEEYAKFAADILNQFARGAYYQNPIHGPRTFGFIGLQTLNDGTYEPLMLAYDFVQPYMSRKRYDMKYYDPVWEKFAERSVGNGYRDCNWFAAENTTLVYSAMLLKDNAKRERYIDYLIDRDSIDGRWGHTSIRSAMVEWFTLDGHWKEPAGYHNFPVTHMMLSVLTLEKNGYRVFDRFPSLFDATTIILKYTFPNLRVSTFGDTGRVAPSGSLLEVAFVAAEKSRPEAMPQLISCAKVLAGNKLYERGSTDVVGLLTYLPEVDLDQPVPPYVWPRSGELDFAKFYLQRNSMDKDYGLMYTIMNAYFNHNHNNGMSLELYGVGDVLAIDPGTGPYYEHELHRDYVSQFAAHNTVVAGGRSTSVPHSTGSGYRQTGDQELIAMEPMPEAEAISPFVSFTDTRYVDKSTQTNQQRTLALIRTSDKSGYYVDIFRSDNKERNDYMYHNIGDKVELFTRDRKAIPVHDAKIQLVGDDHPGFRYISNVKATGKYLDDVVALFTLNSGNPAGVRYLKAYFPYNADRNYYTGYSPKSKTAGSYSNQPVPTLMVQSMGDAWGTPFVALFEPYFGKDGSSVTGVTKLTQGNENEFATLLVDNKDGSKQYIFQSTNSGQREQTGHGFAFKGYFGVASLKGGQLQYLYLGQGKKLSFGDYTIEGASDNCAVNIDVTSGSMKVTSNRPVTITIRRSSINSASLNGQSLSLTKKDNTVSILIPAIQNGTINLR